jgi:hypothetical protein
LNGIYWNRSQRERFGDSQHENKTIEQSNLDLEEGFAVKYCYLFERGEKVLIQVDRVGINTIYPKIRFVFDKKNNVIAERVCAGARLRTTRENNWLSINKKGNTNRALYIYQLIEKIEDREHAKKMLDHYYAGKSSKRGN